MGFHSVRGVAHGHPHPGGGQHIHVVIAIPEGPTVRRPEIQRLEHHPHAGGLAAALGEDFGVGGVADNGVAGGEQRVGGGAHWAVEGQLTDNMAGKSAGKFLGGSEGRPACGEPAGRVIEDVHLRFPFEHTGLPVGQKMGDQGGNLLRGQIPAEQLFLPQPYKGPGGGHQTVEADGLGRVGD